MEQIGAVQFCFIFYEYSWIFHGSISLYFDHYPPPPPPPSLVYLPLLTRPVSNPWNLCVIINSSSHGNLVWTTDYYRCCSGGLLHDTLFGKPKWTGGRVGIINEPKGKWFCTACTYDRNITVCMSYIFSIMLDVGSSGGWFIALVLTCCDVEVCCAVGKERVRVCLKALDTIGNYSKQLLA